MHRIRSAPGRWLCSFGWHKWAWPDGNSDHHHGTRMMKCARPDCGRPAWFLTDWLQHRRSPRPRRP